MGRDNYRDEINKLSAVFLNSPGDPTNGYDIIFGPLCILARKFYRKVSSSTARRRDQIDLAFLREVPDELDRIRYILDVYEKKLVEIFVNAEKVPPQFTRMSSMVRFVCKLFFRPNI